MCLPCMKEFPNFVEFHREMRDQVACASVSLDFVGGEGGVSDEVVDRVQAFLKDQESTMANFVCSDPDESVLARFEHYSVPVSLVFDAEGELARVFKEDDSQEVAKPFTYKDDIGPFVKTLLK